MQSFIPRIFVISAFLSLPASWNSNIYARSEAASDAVLLSRFTSESIEIDGAMDPAWDEAKSYPIEKAVNADFSSPANNCKTSGHVRSLWNGASLYLFIQVSDDNVSSSAERITARDGVEIYIDLWNDKFPKYMEDDGVLYVSAKGERMTRGTDAERFAASAVKPVYNTKGIQTGYNVEVLFHPGGIPIENGTCIGLEIGINNTDAESNALNHKIFWSSIVSNDLHNNSTWGTLVLSGYDGKSPRVIDDYMLRVNIQKAEKLPHGIWQNENTLSQTLTAAKEALGINDQTVINRATRNLDEAIRDLRRKGVFPDPYDLPATVYLPDPFRFQNGSRVMNAADWEKRAEEIKVLAQYYEYGNMPGKPEDLKASYKGDTLIISVTDQGKTVEFEARLSIPDSLPADREGIPVIVSIDFFLWQANPIYLDAGYAVLNFRYTSVAGDNALHTGPFYDLYPYELNGGNDAGTLLAWAWGAMRCIDALEYLAKHDSSRVQGLDLDKLVVTGFSRCGKAALAAGLFDKRFEVVNPGASGCGGAAVYRYASFGGLPKRDAPFGNEYAWGRSPGCEVLGDKIRHQGHNSNQMLGRFLEPERIYETNTYGYGERLPYDHHEIIAAIAPRAVLITTAVDDYSNNAEGDAIGLEGAKPVFEFLGVPANLALNLRATGEANPYGGGGHWLSDQQHQNLIHFSNMIFYQKVLPEDTNKGFYTNPYLPTLEKYYGGIDKMMPWLRPRKSYQTQDSLLCVGSYWTEAEAEMMMMEFGREWDDLDAWESRAELIKQGIIEGMQLESMPTESGDFIPLVRNIRVMDGYSVENIVIESFPGFYITGNLYRPGIKQDKYAAILCPHGHMKDARFADFMQIRCAVLARMGAVVFAYDMLGYGESLQVDHKMPIAMLLQTWNSKRVLDYLISRPDVDSERIGITGCSGGGTQTFILSAIDDRIKVSVPVVQVSAHFFGGCVCESGMPVHRSHDYQTNNVEIAALFAPGPQLLISDGADWTSNTPQVEYPYIQKVYAMYKAGHKLKNVHFPEGRHDYGYAKRDVAYNFLAQHLGLNRHLVPYDEGFNEDFVKILPKNDLSVFGEDQSIPENALYGNEAVINAIFEKE